MKRSLLGFLIFAIYLSCIPSQAQDSLDQNSFENSETTGDADQNSMEGEQGIEVENSPTETNSTAEPLEGTQSPESINSNGVNPSSPSQSPTEFDTPSSPVEEDSSGSQTTLDTLNPGAGGLAEEYFPSFIYDDRGRKDPFAPAIKDPEPVVTSDPRDAAEPTQEEKTREGLSKFEVSALTVTAILVGKNKPKALVKDPTGVVYMIQENDIVGRNNGVVRRIRQGQIVIVESREQKDGEKLYTTQVLSLGK